MMRAWRSQESKRISRIQNRTGRTLAFQLGRLRIALDFVKCGQLFGGSVHRRANRERIVWA